MSHTLSFGPREGLHFQLKWAPRPDLDSGTSADCTRGSLTAWIAETRVWGHSGTIGFEWTWIELLEFLIDAWPYLEFEEGDPLGVGVPDYEIILSEASRRWTRLPRHRALEEAELASYGKTHDLSAALGGAWLRPLWILREGNDAWLVTTEVKHRRPLNEVLETLAEMGTAIAERITRMAKVDARGSLALKGWRDRRDIDADHLVAISTGLGLSEVRKLRLRFADLEIWKLLDGPSLTEQHVAARMAGRALEIDELGQVLRCIGNEPLADPAVHKTLGELSAEALTELAGLGARVPFEQGLAMATWLRSKLKVGRAERVEPKNLLLSWGVPLRTIQVKHSGLDAICCWGPRHGPAVMINAWSARAGSAPAPGRRATLAHEIGHLLMDRSGSLPLAEVLGGRAPRDVEQRANAFAAELLLPRAVAGEALARTDDAPGTVRQLLADFGASRAMVAWQAARSSLARSLKWPTIRHLAGFLSEQDQSEFYAVFEPERR